MSLFVNFFKIRYKISQYILNTFYLPSQPISFFFDIDLKFRLYILLKNITHRFWSQKETRYGRFY